MRKLLVVLLFVIVGAGVVFALRPTETPEAESTLFSIPDCPGGGSPDVVIFALAPPGYGGADMHALGYSSGYTAPPKPPADADPASPEAWFYNTWLNWLSHTDYVFCVFPDRCTIYVYGWEGDMANRVYHPGIFTCEL